MTARSAWTRLLVVALTALTAGPVAAGSTSVERSLTVAVVGAGTVTSADGGITCGVDCAGVYAQGERVVLTATPAPGEKFVGWGETCDGESCTVTMDEDRSVTATFTGGAQERRLTVQVAGSGSVTSADGGITCGVDCAGVYAQGERVVLTATPAAGMWIEGWGGACSGTAGCTVTVDEDRSVTATFTGTSQRRGLTVVVVGSGSVTSAGGGITCGVECAGVYAPGERVTLTATPAPGGKLLGWGGACSGTGGCTVTMATDRSVTATFSG